MFRKAASAIVPVPTEPGGDAVVNQDAERIEPTPPTSEPEETANEAAAQPKPLRAGVALPQPQILAVSELLVTQIP